MTTWRNSIYLYVRGILVRFHKDCRGITGLETAIVLIAFVVVASVFAFTVLTTGLFATEKTKESVQSGLRLSGETLAKKGATFLRAGTAIDTITFKLSNALGTEVIDLSPDKILVTYSDDNQNTNAIYADSSATDLPEQAYWDYSWPITGTTGPAVDPGEIVEFTINVSNLPQPLGPNTRFNIEVIPSEGAVIPITGVTPLELQPLMNLSYPMYARTTTYSPVLEPSPALNFNSLPVIWNYAGRSTTWHEVNLNDSGSNVITVAPNDLVTASISMSYTHTNGYCTGCIVQFYVRMNNEFAYCIRSGSTNGGGSVAKTFEFRAPSGGGVYYIQPASTLDYSCQDSTDTSDDFESYTLGTVVVTDA